MSAKRQSVADHGRRQGTSPLPHTPRARSPPPPSLTLAPAGRSPPPLPPSPPRSPRPRPLSRRRRREVHDQAKHVPPYLLPPPAGSRARSPPSQALPLTLTPAGRVASAGRWPSADDGCAGARWQGMQAGGQPPPTAVARWVGGTAGGAAFGSALNNCQLLLSTEIPSLAAMLAGPKATNHTGRVCCEVLRPNTGRGNDDGMRDVAGGWPQADAGWER